MSADELLRLEGVSAGYDGVAVVHDLDLVVRRGEMVALLGSNGARKTTTLLTVSGLVPRMEGTIDWFPALAKTGVGILVVEQHVDLVLGIPDRACLLRRGRVTFDGPSADLRDQLDLVEDSYLGGEG